MLINYFSHLALLLLDRTRGINYCQTKFINHAIVLLEDLALKHRETFLRIVDQPISSPAS